MPPCKENTGDDSFAVWGADSNPSKILFVDSTAVNPGILRPNWRLKQNFKLLLYASKVWELCGDLWPAVRDLSKSHLQVA